MALLSRDAILAAEDFGHEDVEVSEWGGTVRIRVMSGAQRNAFQQSMIVMDGGKVKEVRMENMMAKLLAYCLVDEKGAALFKAEELGKKSGLVLDRLFTIAQRLNGLDEGATAAAVKNFPAIPSGGSISS